MAGLFGHLLSRITFRVTARLVTDMLGTVPKSKDVYSKYIASKYAEDERKKLKAKVKEMTTRIDTEQGLDRTELERQIMDEGQAGEDLVARVMLEEESTVEEAEEKGWTGR